MSQAELFDVVGVGAAQKSARAPTAPLGEALKERGQAKARANVDPEYAKAFNAEVLSCIRSVEEFTVETVTDVVGLPANRNAVGALMSGWSSKLRVVRHTRSKRPERHSGLIAVYVSKMAGVR